MRKRHFLIVLFLILSYSDCSPQGIDDVQISSVISLIDSDSIRSTIQHLENYGGRFPLSPNRFEIADWIYKKFKEVGIQTVEKDSFMSTVTYPADTTTLQVNIIATIPGSMFPDQVYIIGAHYDSYSMAGPLLAPGADDNASGTAAVIEIARAIKTSGIQPAATIKFIAFAIEELMYFGNSGSEHYALEAKNRNENIKLMINLDMISHTLSILSSSKVKVMPYTGFGSYATVAIDATRQFTQINSALGNRNHGTDSYAFYEQGYPAVCFFENDFSPYYHTDYDQSFRYSMDYCREVTKGAAAAFFKAQNLLTEVKDDSVPERFALLQNYPNPFNSSTVIKYTLSYDDNVSLIIYDVLGNKIKEVVNERISSGEYTVEYNAKSLAGGIYFCELSTSYERRILKMIYLK
jgi:hypothetical protein